MTERFTVDQTPFSTAQATTGSAVILDAKRPEKWITTAEPVVAAGTEEQNRLNHHIDNLAGKRRIIRAGDADVIL